MTTKADSVRHGGEATEPLPTIAGMPTIALPELTVAAGLQTRHDRKYLVPVPVLDTAIGDTGGVIRALQISGGRAFGYRSSYFDTDDLVSFRGTAHRRRRRFKVRTRRYGDNSCFLEVKTRDGRGATVKTRRSHDPAAARELGVDDVAFIHGVLAGQGVPHGELGELRPVIDTSYTRSTLYLPDSGARVTVDRHLAWHRPDGTTWQVTDLAVAETKSPSTACAIDHALWRRGYRPTALSKYATGMTLISPELPSNRWHRVRRALASHLHEVR